MKKKWIATWVLMAVIAQPFSALGGPKRGPRASKKALVTTTQGEGKGWKKKAVMGFLGVTGALVRTIYQDGADTAAACPMARFHPPVFSNTDAGMSMPLPESHVYSPAFQKDCDIFDQFSSTDYQAQSSAAKLNQLWDAIVKTEYRDLGNLPVDPPSGVSAMNPLYLRHTFTTTSDVLPPGRKKLIHPFGPVAKVEFRVTPGFKEGIFHSGCQDGLLRLSLAEPESPGHLVPGIGYKCLISGAASVNMPLMPSLDGQSSSQIFEYDYANFVPDPTFVNDGAVKAFAKKYFVFPAFRLTTWMLGWDPYGQATAQSMPLEEMTQVYANGTRADRKYLNTRWNLVFRPTNAARAAYPAAEQADFRVKLAKMPAGTVLFEVGESVNTPMGVEFRKLGEIVMTSSFVNSQFGDDKLFFEHPEPIIDPPTAYELLYGH